MIVDRDWIDGLQRPGGRQVQFLRTLLESRPYFRRIPDQTLIAGDVGRNALHVQATRDIDGTYAFVYIPTSEQTVKLNLTKLRGRKLRAWWYDPRTGVGILLGMVDATPDQEFRTRSYGPDWVLVLDDPDAGYPPPGLKPWQD